MSDNVLDSSTILAILRNERIDEMAYSVVDGGVMSAVNVAEIYSKLAEWGIISASKVEALLSTLDRIVPFTTSQAWKAGLLRETTRHAGLSLGDRCCLALALEIDADVYTAEHVWGRVDIGCKIHVIRELQV